MQKVAVRYAIDFLFNGAAVGITGASTGRIPALAGLTLYTLKEKPASP